jgi:hypothetical protein
MDRQGELIVNASYRDLLAHAGSLPRETFVMPEVREFEHLENGPLTRALALHLQDVDLTPGVLYGIEIKSNGGERSGRIPLVRVNGRSPSVWKITRGIKSLQKSVVVLNELVEFLRQHGTREYSDPKKVLVLSEDERLYTGQTSKYHRFVSDLTDENGIYLFSLGFLQQFIDGSLAADLDTLLSGGDRVFGTQKS